MKEVFHNINKILEEVVVFIGNKASCFDVWNWGCGASLFFKVNTPYTQGKITMVMY